MPSSACKNQIRSEEHTSELQSHDNIVCRLLLEKKKVKRIIGFKRRDSMTKCVYHQQNARGHPVRPSWSASVLLVSLPPPLFPVFFFFFKDTATTEIYPLSLHAALPILITLESENASVVYIAAVGQDPHELEPVDRKSTRLNSSHTIISYAVFCLKT